MKQKQNGFAHVEIVIIAVVFLSVAAFVGYRLMNQNQPASNNEATTSNQQQAQKPAAPTENSTETQLKLASDAVQFRVPKTWEKGRALCAKAADEARKCVDGATLTPPEKMPTGSGGGTEFFNVSINVFDNKQNKPAQQWYEEDGRGGLVGDDMTVSNDSINGYSTHFRRQVTNSYDDIDYIYTANGKVVNVSARVSEKHYDAATGQVDDSRDFTKYVPEIEKLAKTVKFN